MSGLLQNIELPDSNLPWLFALREQGREAFIRQGLPTAKTEAWKYTRPRDLQVDDFVMQTSPCHCSDECDCEHHHHSSDESDADCDLRQLFVISAREEQLLPIYHGNQTEPSWSPTLPYVSDLFSSYCLPQNDTPNNLKYPPLIERLRSIAAGHIFALRAPPAIIA